MSSHVKHICGAISREQFQSIRDLTSGHLNEKHLYQPPSTVNEEKRINWPSSQKPPPVSRPRHRLTTHSSTVEQMKDSLADFTYLTLPNLPLKKPFISSKVSFPCSNVPFVVEQGQMTSLLSWISQMNRTYHRRWPTIIYLLSIRIQFEFQVFQSICPKHSECARWNASTSQFYKRMTSICTDWDTVKISLAPSKRISC